MPGAESGVGSGVKSVEGERGQTVASSSSARSSSRDFEGSPL
jgi:hypothetical protein